ncbi:hypothetical protein HPB51_028973 [Rhipicephalus microplus]|uniref:Uncharacterized protein n=1 Tax=Rhipicephalus microplus TaxID=6941 RepID=A0A9J6CVV4_RHIMP|nr:hypothetical protein HPB51_028973 [Rhipicephalus microplus]
MTAQEIDVAFRLLSGATEKQLCSFGDMNAWWLPPKKEHGSKKLALEALRETVESCESRQQKLERLGYFYCWMAPLRILQTWTLITLGDMVKQEAFNATAFLTDIAKAVRNLGHETTFVTMHNDSLVYGCLLVENNEPPPANKSQSSASAETPPADVICMCCWPSLPFMAVYATDSKAYPLLDNALTKVLGYDCEPLLRGDYEYLIDARLAVIDNTSKD